MYLIKDILKDKFVSNISRWQGSPLVTIRGKTEAKQYETYEEARTIIKTKLCAGYFEVVTL